MAGQARPLQRRARYIYPVPTSEKVTGFKLTLVGAYLWRTALDGTTRPSTVFQHSAYSTKHQLLIVFGGDLWSTRNTRNLTFEIGYSRSPAPFFGIGARTQSAQELFTPRTYGLQVTAQREVRPHTYAQLGFHLQHTSVVDLAPGGLLIGDTVLGSAGYTVIAPELGLSFDSRDQLFDPKRGAFIQGHVRVNLVPLGGSSGFQLFSLDARAYRPVRPGGVLAVQGAIEGATGNVPFEELPQLGGSQLRAYVFGRWRDRTALHGQIEWRQHVVWRFGAVGFAGAGAIGSGIGALGPVRTTYGAGLRFNLSTKENANFSLDYARGQQGANAVSIGFAEAF
jgi:outer membrane protein assembly factor BamA